MAQSPQFRKKSKTDKANNQGANYYLSQRKFFNKRIIGFLRAVNEERSADYGKNSDAGRNKNNNHGKQEENMYYCGKGKKQYKQKNRFQAERIAVIQNQGKNVREQPCGQGQKYNSKYEIKNCRAKGCIS